MCALVVAVGGYFTWRHFTAERVIAYPPHIYDHAPSPGFLFGAPLREMDIAIFDALAKGEFRRSDLLDLFPERPYHVKLVGSTVDKHIQFVLIDLHRSGVWDERWELKEKDIDRRTFDNSGTGNSTPFALQHGRWLPY